MFIGPVDCLLLSSQAQLLVFYLLSSQSIKREREKTPIDQFRVQMRFMNFPQKMPSVAIYFRLFYWRVNVTRLTHSRSRKCISISVDRVTCSLMRARQPKMFLTTNRAICAARRCVRQQSRRCNKT